jgi:carboxymethylenebutenolidase
MLKIASAALALMLLPALGCCVWAADVSGQKMQLPAKERKVDVTLFRAPGDKPRGAVLMLHGAGGFDRQIAQYNAYASAVANSGFDAYLVYYRSDDDMKRLATGENVFEHRIYDWAREVDDLADYLKVQKDSNGKVGLIGFSDGGSIGVGAAAMDKNINAAVIYYGTDAENFGIVEKRFPPMLLLHGENDSTITWMNSELTAQHVKSLKGHVEFVLFPGEKHGFGSDITTKHGADALSRTLVFLHQQMDRK